MTRHPIARALLVGALLLLAAGCSRQVRTPAPPPADQTRAPASTPGAPAATPPEYVDGLYRPDLHDSGPEEVPDISGIPEPIPVVEPRSKYGNRSPYSVLGKTYRVLESPDGYVERGTASWYGNKFHGRPTSSFEPYDMYRFSAAHRTLPLPSYARVTNLDNGKSVVVRVNDRGPFHGGRLIDLSYVAAVKLDMLRSGTAHVEVRALTPGEVADGDAMPGPGKLYLQAGAFVVRDNAERLQRRLREAGLLHVQLQRTEVAGQSVWRVRVGPYEHPGALDEARRTIRALGTGEPQTVSH